MSSLIFHWAPYSTASCTVAILDELEHGLSAPLAQRVEHSLHSGELHEPPYLAINPVGRVPAIEHNGTPIFESSAITMYLGETFGVDRKDANGNELESLYPALGPQRGEAMKWIVWSNICLGDAGSRLFQTMGFGRNKDELAKLSEEVKADRIENARKDMAKWLGILDGALDGKEYLVGGKYSLADTHVQSFTRYVGILGVDLNEYKHLKAWSDRVASRPALKDKQ